MDDLKPVFDLAYAYAPKHFGIQHFKDVHTVRLWVARGCDIKEDIVPAMDAVMKRNGHITSFSYFTGAIEQWRDRRLAREIAQQEPQEEQKKASDGAKAKNIAFLTRKLGKRLPTEERWLKDYELQHGEVAL
jgi:hypothetical protein